MKYLKYFESKQVGNVYHFCRYSDFKNIVHSDFIFSTTYSHKDGKFPTISLTRNSSGSFMKTDGRGAS